MDAGGAGGGGAGAGGGVGGRFRAILGSIPLGTRIILAVNISIYLYTLFTDYDVSNIAICLYPVSQWGQWSRIFSAAYFHLGFLHVLFNMFTFFSIGCYIEQRMGTIALIGQSFFFTALVGLVYLGLEYSALQITNDLSYWGNCAVGYSGVIFAYIMVEVAVSAEPMRSLCGMCNVPSWIYPWIMLILISLIMRNVSFFGHLAGIIVGWLYGKGLLMFITPPRQWILNLENALPATIRNWTSYAPYPLADPLTHHYLPCVRGFAEGRGFECPDPPRLPPCLSCTGLLMFIESIQMRRREAALQRLQDQEQRQQQRNRYERVDDVEGGGRGGGGEGGDRLRAGSAVSNDVVIDGVDHGDDNHNEGDIEMSGRSHNVGSSRVGDHYVRLNEHDLDTESNLRAPSSSSSSSSSYQASTSSTSSASRPASSSSAASSSSSSSRAQLAAARAAFYSNKKSVTGSSTASTSNAPSNRVNKNNNSNSSNTNTVIDNDNNTTTNNNSSTDALSFNRPPPFAPSYDFQQPGSGSGSGSGSVSASGSSSAGEAEEGSVRVDVDADSELQAAIALSLQNSK